MRFVSSLVCISLAITLAACGQADPDQAPPVAEEAPDQLVVYTVNYPLAYFAERLGGDAVDVIFPTPSDEDPATWSPDADTIAAFQGADLILLNGAGYAKWVERATLPTSKLVNTTAGATDRLLELSGTVTHSHGPEGEHEHHGWASTTWLDPAIAADQARAVATALQTKLPDSGNTIGERLTGLEADLIDLDKRLASAANVIGDEPLLFSHPVYQYLIHRYGFNGHQLHWEPDVEPNGKAWSKLAHLLDHEPAQWMLWESEPLETTAAALDQRSISSVVFSPCANTPAEGDWLTVMTTNAQALELIANQRSQ